MSFGDTGGFFKTPTGRVDRRASSDGATAVNSIQLWDPLAASAAEVARVLRPGARLVTVTHDWVLRDPDTVSRTLTENGFADARRWPAKADEGRATMLVATAS